MKLSKQKDNKISSVIKQIARKHKKIGDMTHEIAVLEQQLHELRESRVISERLLLAFALKFIRMTHSQLRAALCSPEQERLIMSNQEGFYFAQIDDVKFRVTYGEGRIKEVVEVES